MDAAASLGPDAGTPGTPPRETTCPFTADAVVSYDTFKEHHFSMTARRPDRRASEEKLQRGYRSYVSWPTPTSLAAWCNIPTCELLRWLGRVHLEPPATPLVTFKCLLMYIASFALINRLVRMDERFKDHVFSDVGRFYNFTGVQVKAINTLFDSVKETSQGSIYIPKKMKGGYVFVDGGDGEQTGMIRWYEVGGGNPKYSFWVKDGEVVVGMG
jgi:hypothetical protein